MTERERELEAQLRELEAAARRLLDDLRYRRGFKDSEHDLAALVPVSEETAE